VKNTSTPTDASSWTRHATASAILLIWTLITGLLWGLERWQRPSFTRIPSDGMLLLVACLGVLGMAVLQGFKNKAAHFWRRLLIVCLCGVVLLLALHFGCREMAVSALKTRLDEHSSLPSGWVKVGSETLSTKLHKLLENYRVSSPDWLVERVNALDVRFSPTPDQLIEQSRWSVRRAMAEVMVSDSKRAKFLMENWADYFPAFIGPDVTLECRSDLMERLHVLQQKRGRSLNSSQTIDFCMALIVLTDPLEFEKWRVPVRDAMLQRETLANHNRELWMRTIDTLLALDPPESWVELTAPLTKQHSDFRIAMRQPVRGLVGNFDALLSVFDLYEHHNHRSDAFVLWQGVGDSLEAWPEALDEDVEERIRNWRRDTLFRWLMTYTDDGKSKFRYFGAFEEMKNDFAVLELTHEQQMQLAKAAVTLAHTATSTDESNKQAIVGYLRHLDKVAPYLTNDQRENLGRSLIPLIIKPEIFHQSTRDDLIYFDHTWTLWLWEIEPLMSPEQRDSLQAILAPLMSKLRLDAHSTFVLLCVDAWSERPAMSREFWLACAWNGWWRTVPANTPREQLDLFESHLLPVPPVDQKVIDVLALDFEAALAMGGYAGLQSSLDQRLNHGMKSAPHSFGGTSYGKFRRWQINGTYGAATLAEFFKSELYLRGLIESEEVILQNLKEQAKDVRSITNEDIYRSPHADKIWRDTLNNPHTAGVEATQYIGKENEDSPLHGLITTMETTPPDEAVVRAVWDALLQRSHNAKYKAEIYGALFRLSHLMPRKERLAMRRDASVGYFLFTNSHTGSGFGYEPNPLLYPGGGIGIPWEDDELSAKYSWKTAISRQVKQFPRLKTESHRAEVFSYLAHDVTPIQELGKRREGPEVVHPSAPLPPTPWQRARELHLRRPDLEF